MCTTLYFYFYVDYSVLRTKNLVFIHHHTVYPLYPFLLPACPYPYPLVKLLLCSLYQHVYFCLVCFIHLFWFFCLFFIFHIGVKSYSVFVWLISFSIIPSRSIHFVTNGKISTFLRLSSIPLCMYVCIYIYICVCVCVYVYIHTTPFLSIYLLMDT